MHIQRTNMCKDKNEVGLLVDLVYILLKFYTEIQKVF